MKIEAIIKALENLNNPITEDDLTANVKRYEDFSNRMTAMAKKTIRAIPLSALKIHQMTGISQYHLSMLNNDYGAQIPPTTLINIMFKLGYEVEIKLTKI